MQYATMGAIFPYQQGTRDWLCQTAGAAAPSGGRELHAVNDRGGSMQRHRRMRQATVAFQRVFNFLLGRGVLRPGTQALLKHFSP